MSEESVVRDAQSIIETFSRARIWHPISSAPNNQSGPLGGTFLAYAPHSSGGYCLVSTRNVDGLVVDTVTGESHGFTHWTPLPTPPGTNP